MNNVSPEGRRRMSEAVIATNKRRALHNQADSPTYKSWACMIQRCTNPKNPKFARYGGRGIKVCERWLTFANFLADMGIKPQGSTIERKDNNSNYDPANCEWIPHKVQARNRSNNRAIEFCGETRLEVEWAERLKIPYGALRTRLHRGWSVFKAFSTPIRRWP